MARLLIDTDINNSSSVAPVQGYGPISINAQTGTTYTLVASDKNKVVTCDNASAVTLTVPNSVFSAGDKLMVIQKGAGSVTITAGSGLTLNVPASSSATIGEQWGSRALLFLDASTCVLM